MAIVVALTDVRGRNAFVFCFVMPLLIAPQVVALAWLQSFGPSSPLLRAMHTVGRLFPRADRAPAIEPVAERELRRLLATDDGLALWAAGRTQRIASGFYTSQAFELAKPR